MTDDLPPSLAALAGMIAARASAMTGVHPDEIVREIGPGRSLDAALADGRRWTFGGHVVAEEVQVAVAQAMREIGARFPDAATR